MAETTGIPASLPMVRARPIALLAVAFVAWLAAAAFGFWLNRGTLFLGYDGAYMLTMAARQIGLGSPLGSAMIDWYQGLGGIFASFNARLIPGFYPVTLLGGSDLGKVLSYTWFLAELSLGILFFARSLRLSVATGAAASVLTCILMFPFHGNGLIWSILSLVPQVATTMTAALLMGGALFRFGRGDGSDLISGAVFVCGLVWFLFASALGMILLFPLMGVTSLAAMLGCTSRAEVTRKVALILGVLTFLVASGPAAYFAGLLFNTAASLFPAQLENDRASWFFASILFHWQRYGPWGSLLVVSAVLGGLASFRWSGNRQVRMLGITLVTYLCTRLTFAWAVITFDFWRGPNPIHFEIFVIPLYAIFAVLLVRHGIDAAFRQVGLAVPRAGAAPAILASGAVLAAVLPSLKPAPPITAFFPQRTTAITAVLAEEASQRPNEPFRGRVANMIGRSIQGGTGWLPLHTMDGVIMQSVGNEHRLLGLAPINVPGLFNYNSTITPGFFALTTALLADPIDRQMRSVSVLRRIDPAVLRMLGVRFIVTDAPVADLALRVSLPVNPTLGLFLYEVPDANLGAFSPTRLHHASDARAMLARMGAPEFDPRAEAVVAPGVELGALVAATRAEVSFEGYALRVRASSPGRSLLVLPYEYSRCMRVAPGSVQLVRVDLLLAGLVFDNAADATIRYENGPFTNSFCRLEDRSDAIALRIPQALAP